LAGSVRRRYDGLGYRSSTLRLRNLLDPSLRHNLRTSGTSSYPIARLSLLHLTLHPFPAAAYLQDKTDDIQVGIKSTALRFGPSTKPILSAFTATQVSLLTTTGLLLSAGIPYYSGVVAAGALQTWMIRDVDIDDERTCGMWFRRNVWTGGLIWLGCLGEWACRMGGLVLGEWFSVTG